MNRLIARVTQATWLVIGASMLVVIGLAVFVYPDFSNPAPLGAKYRRVAL